MDLLKTPCGGNVKEVDAPAEGRNGNLVNISHIDSISGPALEHLTTLPFIKGAGTHLQGRGRGFGQNMTVNTSFCELSVNMSPPEALCCSDVCSTQ